MVKYTFWHKIIVFINSILALLLLLSYLLPYLSPKVVPIFTVISLAVPILFISNVFFVIYWIIKLKKYFTISLISIVLGFGHVSNIYKFSEKEIFLNDDLRIMSYNVRLLNFYNWINDQAIPEKIQAFIEKQSPDILSVQEYNSSEALPLDYPYVFSSASKTKSELVIFSKYPFLDKGIIKFSNSEIK